MIKLIIFDFDGVIEDNYEQHYLLSQKMTRGITREEHRKLFEGNIHVEREKMKDRFTGYDLKKDFSDSKKNHVVKKEVKDTLITLHDNYLMGIVTSGYEYGVKDYLDNNKIQDLFSFIYGYGTHKIKVYKLEKAIKESNFQKDECVFITDTLGDILEANEIGIKTIAVDFGFHEKQRLEKGNPFKIISNFEELIPAIKSIK